MSGVRVKPKVSSPSATLTRLALDCALTPAQVLQLLACREPLPFALSGNWAGAAAIVGADPLRVADAGRRPVRAARRAARPSTPRRRRTPSAAAGSAGSATAWRAASSASRRARRARSPSPTSTSPSTTTSCGWTPTAVVVRGARRPTPRRDALQRASADSRAAARAAAAAPDRAAAARRRRSRSARPAREHHLAAVARLPSSGSPPGEIFQANLCLRLDGELRRRVTDLFAARARPQSTRLRRRLRHAVGRRSRSLSPELFLRRRGRDVTTGADQGHRARATDGDARRARCAARPRTAPST